MKSILEKVYNESWDEDKYEDPMDVIYENVNTYEEMGQLIAELLGYFSGKYDEHAAKLAYDMLCEYIGDKI